MTLTTSLTSNTSFDNRQKLCQGANGSRKIFLFFIFHQLSPNSRQKMKLICLFTSFTVDIYLVLLQKRFKKLYKQLK